MRRPHSFGEKEEALFRDMLVNVGRLFTVRIVACGFDRSSFHLLVETPEAAADLAETKARCLAFFGAEKGADADLVESWTDRLHDLSHFMRMLQQRFTTAYNRAGEGRRFGTLWKDRYRSILLEEQSPSDQ